MHERNCFITLTYDEEHLPKDESLDVSHWQLFAKRMRKRLGAFRFFHCGEYGENLGRPHVHAAIFGEDFAGDRKPWKERSGNPTWRSDKLKELWTHGEVEISDLTFGSAAYVAGYIVKKITGEEGKAAYQKVDLVSGATWPVKPPYATMSRRPGLGHSFYTKYKGDLYPDDFCVVEGRKYPVPEYYDGLLEKEDPELMERIRQKRAKHARKESPERLRAIEENHEAIHDFYSSRVSGGMHHTTSV